MEEDNGPKSNFQSLPMFGIRLVCLWPGLPGAWFRGKVQHLLLSVLSAWLACFLLLATYLWPEWIGTGSLRILWGLFLLAWLVCAVWGHWSFAQLVASTSSEYSAPLELAQQEYLRGSWFAAEARLLEILHAQPRDAEALLLLTSVLRQTRRWQPALRRLNQLQLLDGAARWRFEISREKQLIEQAMVADAEDDPGDETVLTMPEHATEEAAA